MHRILQKHRVLAFIGPRVLNIFPIFFTYTGARTSLELSRNSFLCTFYIYIYRWNVNERLNKSLGWSIYKLLSIIINAWNRRKRFYSSSSSSVLIDFQPLCGISRFSKTLPIFFPYTGNTSTRDISYHGKKRWGIQKFIVECCFISWGGKFITVSFSLSSPQHFSQLGLKFFQFSE